MRQIVGLCPHCLEGRAYRPAASQPTSTSPPIERLGQVISFDPQKLPNPVLGGFTHKITMVDENSGFISQPGATSKSTGPVFDAMHGVISKQYNANNVPVENLHGDSENINISLRPKFGSPRHYGPHKPTRPARSSCREDYPNDSRQSSGNLLWLVLPTST